ncbi:ABC transporter ATP-binding protein [Ferrovum sp. PN-J185]|uniref:ABC transporter ATP-binding protein n=1 Tax=Ferrovum sp. PN-J185 TaxID=1356306 RepID=UPI00079827F9|nr:ABC transporter ATP-binding protein [Ferrovum sp. PN-J185]KXW56553.1 lipopolysaccharide export system ATP-binding protein LptB [Ferrovum sp. PN-J185]MCC6068099.1 ABC transporter ATP-binding protein [Ferrovum sp. PN-J185]MDE1891790.1 ABC transporter ATP-binding protein [Betaproteobacteria bacterium]MDE2056364.1 ABC transporter ATP-binding protein [Betaproteobacteria bacterium]
MTTPILSLKNISKRFGGLLAVNGVHIDIMPGETVGLIGPNGAGKTTLVSLISGTLTPTTGDIVFQGQNITALPAFERARLGIGRTFQIMKPFPGLTVLDNVAVGALYGTTTTNKALSQARDEAMEWLSRMDLQSKAHQRAEELGGPDRKRLELAKAMAMKPTLLLLDEVMAGLNLVEIDEVIEAIKVVRETGISILVIEHMMKVIQSLSDRLLVLHHGQQIMAGTPQEVLNDARVIEAYLGKRRV